MKSPGDNPQALKRPVKIYDVKKKELILTFDSCYEAEKFLGMRKRYIPAYIRTKARHFSKKLNKLICFR